MFTLYQYLHCPYCVRADMVANYSGLPHKKVLLLNDDEKTCVDLVGVKMVPILQTEDGHAMGESLDIVAKILSMAPPEKQLLPKTTADQITGFISQFSSAINHLLFPRNVMIAQPEFETEGARAYFQKKKEKMLGVSFDDADAFADTLFIFINSRRINAAVAVSDCRFDGVRRYASVFHLEDAKAEPRHFNAIMKLYSIF